MLLALLLVGSVSGGARQACVASDTAISSGLVNDATPPERFRSDASSRVTYLPPEAVDRACAPEPRPCGVVYYGCATHGRVTLPNPCAAQFAGERFAELACHELGHVNGWPATHGP